MNPRNHIAKRYPLSPQQQGMFLESELSPGRSLHMEQSVWRIEGDLDPRKFREAWQGMVDRHEVLRSCFAWGEGREPVQFVLEPFRVEMEEISANDPGDLESAVQNRLEESAERGFPLNRPPLMDFALLRESARRHYFVWNHHHILLDGRSVRLLAEELLERCRGNALPPAPRPYREYVEWLGSRDRGDAERYWYSRFGGERPATAPGRPAGEPRTGVGDEAAARRSSFTLPEPITRRLRERTRSSEATLNHLVKAAWAGLLSSWHPGPEVCYGVTVSGRPWQLEGAERMIGLFINALPEPVAAAAGDTADDLVRFIQEQEYEREAHEFYSTGEIHRWSGLPGSEPLFRSLLVFEEHRNGQPASSGDLSLRFEKRWYRGARTAHPLTLLFDAARELTLELVADPRHLSPESADSIGRSLMALLRQIAEKGTGEPVGVLCDALTEPPPRFHKPPSPPPLPETGRPVDPAMHAIWKEVLGMEAIPPGSDFFELGGHSLLAMRIANRIRDRYGVEIPLRSLFRNPTVDGMAEQVRSISESMRRIDGRSAGEPDKAEEEGEL